MFNFSVITNYCNKLKRNYVLQKNHTYSKISKSPNINFNTENKYLFNNKFNEHINNFIKFIEENSNADLKLFYENLKTLIIKEKRNFNTFLFIKTSVQGHYSAYINKISVLKDDNFYSIYHELLHCASRKLIDDKLFVGFHKLIYCKKENLIIESIGTGITEGYTALLEDRYFSSLNHNNKKGYHIEKHICSFVEKIIEKDEMEKLYFSANPDGLIECLQNFSNEEDIRLFLSYLDKICKEKKIKPTTLKKIYMFIGAFLLKAYISKLITMFKTKEINRLEFENLFDEFIQELSSYSICDKKETYYFMTKELTDQILDEVNDALDKKQKNKIM